NVFRERYITPLDEDELDERPYESNELYDEELTPAPNQIEGTSNSGAGTTNHNKYSSVGGGGESVVKAENIVTFNQGGGGTGSGDDTQEHSSLLPDGQLLIVAVAVLFFCCLCLSIGALLAYRMKLYPSGSNRCIKASESSDSQSTPSSYRAPSEDFDLVECMPDTATMTEKRPETPMQTFVQPVSTPIPVSSVPTTTLLPAFKFAEPRGSLSQISTTMFILPNYLMGSGPVGTLPNRRPKDTLPPLPPGENLTITLTTADISGASSQVDPRRELAFYSHPQPHQHHHHPPYGAPAASCAQCAMLGDWKAAPPLVATSTATNASVAISSSPPVFGGKLLALESPATGTSQTSHPYHRNQSLKSSAGDADERKDGTGCPAPEPSGNRGPGAGHALTQQHSFLWLGLKVGLM
uniref:Uncharacterized protein n=1 Tax=Anopheles atroparvus TaxID=41427 RepID=A0A182J2L1_ANOAO